MQPTSSSQGPHSCVRGLTLCQIVILTVLTVAAQAETLVSSLGNAPMAAVGFTGGSWAASPFQTDGQSWNLASITLILGNGGIGNSTTDLHLFSDIAGGPGVSLAQLSPLTLSGGGSLSPVTFTAAATLVLAPSTTYWVAVGNTSLVNGLNVGVLFSDTIPSFTFTGKPGAVMEYRVTSGRGDGGNPPTTWQTPGPDTALPFSVDASPVLVPEPSQMALLFLASVGFFVRRRSHRVR